MSDIYNPAVPVRADEPLPPPRPGSNNDWVRSNARGYSILEQPCGVKRKVKVIAVGAGAAGIDLAKAVDTRMENVELAIYERQNEVGGCWNSSRQVYDCLFALRCSSMLARQVSWLRMRHPSR
jgi:hypothetical protein